MSTVRSHWCTVGSKYIEQLIVILHDRLIDCTRFLLCISNSQSRGALCDVNKQINLFRYQSESVIDIIPCMKITRPILNQRGIVEYYQLQQDVSSLPEFLDWNVLNYSFL